MGATLAVVSDVSFAFSPLRLVSACQVVISTPEPAATVTLATTLPVTPLAAAMTELVPDATPVASPDGLIVATDVFPIDQVAVEVMFAVEPSL
jgi:hypothetical protein